jgi:hypothetical protein
VNLLRALVDPDIRLVIPQDILDQEGHSPASRAKPCAADPYTLSGRDASPSGMEWGWVCRMLEAGKDPEQVRRDLIAVAGSRRGDDVERYAQRTVESAMRKVGRRPK